MTERALRRGSRRDEALEAAEDLFGRRGCAAVSMRDIATEVPGSLRHRVASKEAPVPDANRAAVAAFRAPLDRALDGVAAPRARLEAATAHPTGPLRLGRRVAAESADPGARSPEAAAAAPRGSAPVSPRSPRLRTPSSGSRA